MSRYEGWCQDPDTDTALDLLAGMVAGSGFYVQMPAFDDDGKTIDPNHHNLAKCKQWLRDTHFLTIYRQIQRVKMAKGFCPIETLPDGTLKIIEPETFYIVRNTKGAIQEYRQKINETVVARWKPDEIHTFTRNGDMQHPYGIALVDSIGELIDARKQLNEDIAKIIHRFAAPRGIHECDKDIASFKQAMLDADVDEDIYVGNVSKDSLRHTFLEPDPRVKFEPFIDRIDIQISQRLHAPLLLLIKSSTEASATKMLESVDREVQAEQEQNAEVIEHEFFGPLCGSGPIPEFIHGLPNAKLEKTTVGDLSILYGNRGITWKQLQELLRQKGLPLIEDSEPKPPEPSVPKPMTDLPFQKKNPPPNNLEFIDHINDIDTALGIIRENYEMHKIPLTEACQLAGEVIVAHMKQAYPETWQQEREKKFTSFTQGLVRFKHERT